MKHFILAPDSFKGTLSAREVCGIYEKAILRHFPHAQIRQLPMADGGEGLVEACCALMGGEKRILRVNGPLGRPTDAVYGILPDGSAVAEMAAAAGLPLVAGETDILHTSTAGVGQLIRELEQQGIRRLLLGLGGSCTNDCGIGMAGALGWRFLDGEGAEVPPLTCNLGHIHTLLPPAQPLSMQITAACDVDNPLLGPRGATYTFAPQKGASPEQLPLLETDMAHFARVLEAFCGRSCDFPGAGAAGGMGAAVRLLLGGELVPGAELVLRAAHFDELLEKADCVLTGEGRMDGQSAAGKVPAAVAAHCRQAGVPCLAICGALGPGARELYSHGITAMFSAVPEAMDFAGIQSRCRENLLQTADSVMRLLSAIDGTGASGIMERKLSGIQEDLL